MPDSNHQSQNQKMPSLTQNWISLIGMILSASSFFAVICLIGMDLIRESRNPYMGILTYLVAPAFLVAGLSLIVLGMFGERRRRHRLAPGEVPKHLQIDFNNPQHRRNFAITTTITIIFLLMTAFGSYQTYHFTESVQFCGQTCHTVMEPEFTAYQNSPHARVACVECHIGEGATWFVKSKLSGSYQVYSVLAKKYSRPIPTPVHNLRPAQDTCEKCHWPEKFFGQSVRANKHFLADESNTVWNINLLMNIGGADESRGGAHGIHWHVSKNHTTEYIATDESRQTIPWVRVTHADGTVVVYQSKDNPLKPEQIASAVPRTMDCMDCHNRPSHIYQAPASAVNIAMAAGHIDPKLPGVKKAAVEALIADYKTSEEAAAGIADKLREQYGDATVVAVQRIYKQNFFPYMRVNWRAYPNNIGHTIFPGCYRCHDGNHASPDGKVITHDCNACHIIIGQGSAEEARQITPAGLEFRHPTDIADMWKEMNCAECHNGALAGP
jgi:hypothetical protein